jgi:hypothetical protein
VPGSTGASLCLSLLLLLLLQALRNMRSNFTLCRPED